MSLYNECFSTELMVMNFLKIKFYQLYSLKVIWKSMIHTKTGFIDLFHPILNAACRGKTKPFFLLFLIYFHFITVKFTGHRAATFHFEYMSTEFGCAYIRPTRSNLNIHSRNQITPYCIYNRLCTKEINVTLCLSLNFIKCN